jgi:ankyrin repeat protein
MSVEGDYLGAFEEHSPEGIRAALAAGASATALINGKAPIECFIEGYLRSAQFGTCLQILLDAGASIDDPLLKAVLLDDAPALQRLLNIPGQDLNRKLRVPCAFTSCEGVTALHICAEFNSVRCAQILINAGADVNARADMDADGFGGQTPIFHAVNSILNYCRPMLELVADTGADLDIRLKGLVWGPGADWETLLLDVTPISYAQCGLYAQFHRAERDVYRNLSFLYRKRHGSALPVRNVPNKYLAPNR